MDDSRRPTIIDVAMAAGVGASTVSRYVRGAKSVSARMSERIEAAIANLGYEPNVLARGLRVGRTRAIGVLFPHVANLFYSEALRAIEMEAHRNGFTVLLLTHHEDQGLQHTQLATLKQFQCDGIVLIAAAGTLEVQVAQILGSTPLVALDRPLGQSWDSVTLHNYKAGRRATEHLLAHGHRHLVAITAPYPLETLNRRLKGFQDAVRAADVSGQVLTLRDSQQLGSELRALFNRSRAPVTAVVSLSYSLTVGSLRALRAGGMSLLERGFIGIDDLEFATLLDPPITTLAQPARSLAKLAIDRLLKRIEGNKSSVYHTKLAGELIIRGSCGCVQNHDEGVAAAD